jgi:shikimate dehydrogenase
MKVFAMIGSPIAQVKLPKELNRLFQLESMDAVMIPVEVSLTGLEVFINMFRQSDLKGLMITLPFKAEVIAHCDTVSLRARQCNAVNIIRRNRDNTLAGDMIDGEGFVRSLEGKVGSLFGKSVHLVGCGGAGSAIAWALAKEGIRNLTIYDLKVALCETLRNQLQGEFPQLHIAVHPELSTRTDVVINASATGMNQSPGCPIDRHSLRTHMTVCEAITEPKQTELIVAAQAVGCQLYFGEEMAHSQISIARSYWGI